MRFGLGVRFMAVLLLAAAVAVAPAAAAGQNEPSAATPADDPLPPPLADDPALAGGTGPLVAPSGPSPVADPFPLPAGYSGRVEFWKNVFGVWTRLQVALHDVEYPGLVYEVVELSAAAGSAESEAQVRARKEALEARLQRLEVMVAAGVPLTDDEKSLALLVATRAGTEAIFGAAARIRTQRGIRERFRRGLEISARYDAAFRKVFRDAGLPEDIAYLPHVESSFENVARSSAGAVGMWQFTRSAGKRFLTLTSTIDERTDPLAAARGAARYMREAYELLGSWPLAITSYNHGMGGMLRAKERYGSDFDTIVRSYDGRSFGFASKNFYAEFLAAREIARDPAPYFPEGLTAEPPLYLDEVILSAPATPKSLAKRFGVPASDLAALNPAWTSRLTRQERALPAGLSVWLPGGTLELLAAKAAARQKLAASRQAEKKSVPATAQAQGGGGLVDFAEHVVRRGETLLKIAAAYGVSLEALLSNNGLERQSILHPGQKLRVPKLR